MPCGQPPQCLRTAQAALNGLLVVALVLSPTQLAFAQWRSTQDAEICVTSTGIASLDIAVCSRALRRDDLSDPDRASVLTARGKAYRDSGQTESAIGDFDAALTLNPYSANSFHERARTLDLSGHYEQAVEDFQRALTLSPHFAAARKYRGLAHFYAGNLACARIDLDAAAAIQGIDAEIHAYRGFLNYMENRSVEAAGDFQRVEALNLPYPYLPLWIYLSRARLGDAEPGILIEAHAGLVPGEWPRALLEAYLGRHDPKALIVALENDTESPGERRNLAATHFYLAELERLHGRRDSARSHLKEAWKLAERRAPERVLVEHALNASKGTKASSISSGC